MFLSLSKIKLLPWSEQRGFSLIELVVAGGIMAILVGGGIAAFIRFNEKQQVLGAARELQQLMRSAQTKARAREIPVGVLTCDVADDANRVVAYHVYAPQGAGVTALVVPICGDSLNYSEPAAGDVTLGNSVLSFQLPSSVTLEDEIKLDFLALYGGIKNYNANETYRLTFGSYGMQFSISEAGEIGDVSEI